MHPLDNPSWKALTTHQAQLALATGMARRFPPEMCVHGALALPLPPAFQDLARLSPEPVCLFSQQKLHPPPGWTVTRAVGLFEMVQESAPSVASVGKSDAQIEDLTVADLPQMSALYEATRPGRKLSPKLYQMGGFVGIRNRDAEGAVLVAMACLRLHLPGYREISTVATLPGFEGHGYATALVAELARRIRPHNERPFLTVRTDNQRAIDIYKRLGFRERILLHSTTIRPDGRMMPAESQYTPLP
jgi:ribosomal protein S18 acetylase RimI-like enzyme